MLKYIIQEEKEKHASKFDEAFNDPTAIAEQTEGLSFRSLKEIISESVSHTALREPKKPADKVTKNEPEITTMNDFTEANKKVVHGVADDRNNSSNKNIQKYIKEHGLIGCGITVICAAFGLGITYKISKQSLDQSKEIHKESIFWTKVGIGVTAIGTALSATAAAIGIFLKMKK